MMHAMATNVLGHERIHHDDVAFDVAFDGGCRRLGTACQRAGSLNMARMKSVLVFCTAVAVRVVLAEFGFTENLAGWTHVETAVHSLGAIKEAHALRVLGLSPYAGSSVHAPPLIIWALGPIVGLCPGLRVLPFALADVAAAFGLGRLASLASSSSARQRAPKCSDEGAASKPQSETNWSLAPSACEALYLFNPCTVVACIGNSWSSLEACAVVIAVCAAGHRFAWTAAIAWAMAVHMSLHQVYMVVPLAVLLLPVRHRIAPAAWVFGMQLAFSSAVIMGMTALLAARLGSTSPAFMDNTYGFALRAEDLTPNMGLFWYFFAEIFDHFRAFFLPLSLALATYLLITLFKPFPCAMDMGVCVGLVPLALYELRRLPSLFIVCCALALAATMHPVLLDLWIERYTGNANFVLATTIVHALALTTLVVDVASVTTSSASD